MTHRRQPLRERFAIQWDKRRPMPPYAESFCQALAEYMREVLLITQQDEDPRPSQRIGVRERQARAGHRL